MTTQKKFYLIREDVLPESVKKTLLIKDLLDKNPKLSIFDAVKNMIYHEALIINIRIRSSRLMKRRVRRI